MESYLENVSKKFAFIESSFSKIKYLPSGLGIFTSVNATGSAGFFQFKRRQNWQGWF